MDLFWFFLGRFQGKLNEGLPDTNLRSVSIREFQAAICIKAHSCGQVRSVSCLADSGSRTLSSETHQPAGFINYIVVLEKNLPIMTNYFVAAYSPECNDMSRCVAACYSSFKNIS